MITVADTHAIQSHERVKLFEDVLITTAAMELVNLENSNPLGTNRLPHQAMKAVMDDLAKKGVKISRNKLYYRKKMVQKWKIHSMTWIRFLERQEMMSRRFN